MVATVPGLSPCSNYSLQVGAGPFVYREDGGLSSSYSQPGREESLTTAINKIWASEENAFKAFAITAPVSIRSVSGTHSAVAPTANTEYFIRL